MGCPMWFWFKLDERERALRRENGFEMCIGGWVSQGVNKLSSQATEFNDRSIDPSEGNLLITCRVKDRE